MEIKLRNLLIENFKGIDTLSIYFDDITDIKAANAKGKTTIFDAFTWVLFNKDSRGNAKFGIRPKNSQGSDIDFIDIKVALILEIDGRIINVQKVQKQIWTKKRGEECETFSGNSNEYEWNDIPVKESVFNDKVKAIIDEQIFKLVTNPLEFTRMKWKDQRNILVTLVQEITDSDVIALNDSFLEMESLLGENTIEELIAKNKKAKDSWNKRIKEIPSRIDEVSKTVEEIDFSKKEAMLSTYKNELNDIEIQITDHSKAYEKRNEIHKQIHDTKSEISKIQHEVEMKINEEKNEINKKMSSFQQETVNCIDLANTCSRQLDRKSLELENAEKYLQSTREDFKEMESKIFDEEDLSCPVCGQSYPVEKVEQMKEEFTNHKISELKRIREIGMDVSNSVTSLGNEIKQLKQDQARIVEEKAEALKNSSIQYQLLEKVKEPSEVLRSHTGYIDQNQKLQELEQLVVDLSHDDSVTDTLKRKRADIQSQIDEVNRILSKKEMMEHAKNRIIELKEEQKELAQKVAGCEKQEYLFDEFNKAKMNLLSDRINSKFNVVNWTLFKTNINGGVESICECMVDGVPYSDLNSAMKVNAGLDIINTLTEIYQVTAPIFIDNREGINHLIDTASQIINLIVTEDQELKVEVA